MRKKSLSYLLKSATIWSVFFLSGAAVFPPAAVRAAWTEGVCVGASGTLSADVATIQGITCLLSNVVSAAMQLFGIVGFCMFVYGSFKLMTSAGRPDDFSTAKNTFTFVVLGFIIALSSLLIVNIIQDFTGIEGLLNIQFLSPSNPNDIPGV